MTCDSPNLTEQILSLREGDHLCLFYEKDPAEQMPALLPFIQQSLRDDEQFVYVADDQTVEELVARLESSGIDVGQEAQRGRLKLWTRKEWRQAGELSSETKARQVRQLLADSQAAGFKGTRLGVEMTWTLGPDINAAQLEHWEATLNTIFVPGSKGRIICQYNRSRLAPEAMLAALHTHPLAIVGDEVYGNFFYEAPLILNGDGNGNGHGRQNAAIKVDWMLSQLKSSRKTAREREQLVMERAALAERERAAHTLAAIVESSDDAIVSKDLHGIITSWNRGAERLFGYTAEEMVGQPVLKLIPKDRNNEEIGILARIRHGERIEHYETVRQRKDGSFVDISLTVSPVLDGAGRIVGASKIARDISDKKRTEEALRVQNQTLAEMDERKNEFLAMLGHELRNPLAALQNAAELLTVADDKDSSQWATKVVHRQTALLSRLVDDLVDVARITHGRIELRRDNLDLGPVMQRAVETARPLITERRHALHVASPEGALLASADSARIEQLLVNLLANAAKYTDPGGTIWLSAKRSAGQVVITVKDNGIGISADLLPHIFELFVQEHRGLDRSRGGLGLGLALARRLAEMHGGELSARSDGPGHGSEFILRLPALAETIPLGTKLQCEAVSAQKPGKRCGRIMVVDDNRDSAQGLKRLLEARGYEVALAHDGEAALQMAGRFQPRAFLLDLGLPIIDGYEVARQLRASGFDALYVAISGYAQQRDMERSKRAGFDHHLSKPVDVATILELLETEHRDLVASAG